MEVSRGDARKGPGAEPVPEGDGRARGDEAGPGRLLDWLMRHGLLRGPFLYADYWATVLDLRGIVRESHVRDALVDPVLFRVGLDRPDLEIPPVRRYLFLFFLGPVLLPFRAFRRLGRRYRLRFRREVGEAVLPALEPFRLDLDGGADGRVTVRKDGRPLARDVLDPRRVSGFSSLFFPAYKLPLASLTAILAMAVLAPVLAAAGWLGLVLRYWIPVGFPLLVVVLYVVYRDAVTAVLGALPILFGRYLLGLLRPTEIEAWLSFVGALAGLFLLYVLADWFFMPRPVPPVLLLYSREEPGRPFERELDAPWWLEGTTYWVWRYLMLTPAELNKFWERDWERVELWVRADGPEAGALEWVVTDAHYRELWIPYGRLGDPKRLARHRADAIRHAAEGEAGIWLVEVDADMVFHTPFVRAVSFVPETGDVPVLGLGHLWTALWSRVPTEKAEPYLDALDRARIERGVGVLDDVPEVVANLTARHMLAQPWTRWRYPLGAQRRREPKVYERWAPPDPPPAADPELQIKGPGRPGPPPGG